MPTNGGKIMRTIVILAATIPCIISLMICGEAEMQSFDTPLGKIELDAPWDLKIITDESQDGEFGCKSGENEHCRYGFQDIENAEAVNNGDAYRDYRFDIDFYPQEDDKLTFEEIIKQEWTLDENDPPGEWTTTNEGRKMYFERNSAFDDSIAIIDYLNDTNPRQGSKEWLNGRKYSIGCSELYDGCGTPSMKKKLANSKLGKGADISNLIMAFSSP